MAESTTIRREDIGSFVDGPINSNISLDMGSFGRVDPPTQASPAPTITPDQISGEVSPVVSEPAINDPTISGEIVKMTEAAKETVPEDVQETAPVPTFDDSFNELVKDELDFMGSLKTEDEIRNEAEKGTGLHQKKLALDQINNRILREQVALQRRIEEWQETPGLTKGIANAKIAQEERVAYRKMADMTLVKLGINADYEAAQSEVDSMVNAMFSRQQALADQRKFLFELNYDRLTTKERRAFESAENRRQEKLEADKLAEQRRYDIAMDAMANGAPSNVTSAIMASGDLSGALAASGGYIGRLERMRAANTLALQNMQLRKERMALALDGDQMAIKELGYDPRNLPMTEEEILNMEAEYVENIQDQNRVREMQENLRGINALTGSVRSPLIGGFFAGGEAEGDAGDLARFIPGVGNVIGMRQSLEASRALKTDVEYVTNNLTLENFIQLKAQGATFGALSEGEWRIIGGAASELSAMTVRDEGGDIVGFNATADQLQEQFQIISDEYKKAEQRITSKALGPADKRAIASAYNQ